MSDADVDRWVRHVPNSTPAWLANATRGTLDQLRPVLHTAYIPGASPHHYQAARQLRRQLDALAAEWGRRGNTELSLRLFRFADHLLRIMRQHEVAMFAGPGPRA